MAITALEIKNVLDAKNIHSLYHANTIPTTLSFIEKGGLLSRGAIEDFNLFQTSQRTDSKDKMLGIWYDIFFDSVDIHKRANCENAYGPLTLVSSTDLLLLNEITVKITQDNPIRWDQNTLENDRYFNNIPQLQLEYQKGRFNQHVTFCNMHTFLPFVPYLEKIIFDKPPTKCNDIFKVSYANLNILLSQKYKNIELVIRNCQNKCKCLSNYSDYSFEKLTDHFGTP